MVWNTDVMDGIYIILYMLSLLIMLSGAYRLDRWCRVIIYIFLSFFARGGKEFFNKQNPWGLGKGRSTKC